MRFEFSASLWQWEARSDSWWFVTVPEDKSEELEALPVPPRGFGSIRVRVTVGATTWATSVFPGEHGYVLPMKRAVREKEGLDDGGQVHVALETVDF